MTAPVRNRICTVGTELANRAASVLLGRNAASSLLIGALLAMRFTISPRAVGLIMAFAAGVLIRAVAYELVLVAVEESDAAPAASDSQLARSSFSSATTGLKRPVVEGANR